MLKTSPRIISLTKDNVPEFFRTANLRQYPPQTRTVMLRYYTKVKFSNVRTRTQTTGCFLDEYITYKRVSFPCMSFGEVALSQKDDSKPLYLLPYVFRHSRPWKDYKDAAKIAVRFGGMHRGPAATICMGTGRKSIQDGHITTEEAFWGTTFNVPEDIDFQEQVMSYNDEEDNHWWWSNVGWFDYQELRSFTKKSP